MDAKPMELSLINLISQVGFPIFVSVWLLWSMDRRLIRMLMLLAVLSDRVKGSANDKPGDDL